MAPRQVPAARAVTIGRSGPSEGVGKAGCEGLGIDAAPVAPMQATPCLPVYRTATLFVVSNAGGACRSGRNAQVVITKAVWVHCHSEPSTALSIDFGRVMTTAPPASAAIANVIASAFTAQREKSHGRCSASFGCRH